MVEELIADNIAVLAEGVQGRSKLCFPSTIYRLCKEAGVAMGEFKNSDQIQVARPITAKVMTTTRGRIINQPQNQPMEEDEDNYDAENLYTNHEQNQEMHYEAEMHYEGAKGEEENYQHQEEWTRNASSREGYCCWAHQQANPNLVEIPPHKIPDFLHSNVANKKDLYFGALKFDLQQGESSQVADQTTQNAPNP
ncbi:hypothetical protein PIB30_089539 [Stylosanthes scabra]|uniref:Uncharacterized protein n=1 Tax=Stylosanthes scabra TaxID=79078 RepID=A0ABU6SUB8_9FABA|nr:hypothetical protein [Stylosanthes scabra]